MAVPPFQTREDARIKRNRDQMGVIFFRKEGESRGLSSGSIVKLKGSNLICNGIEFCLMTSDKYLTVRGIGEENYFFEYWSSDLQTVKKLSLREVAQSNDFYNPTPGLALIPVSQSWVSKLWTGSLKSSSVIDERRAFPTSYHSGGGESENKNKLCYIVRSCSCTEKELVEPFTLMTKRDDQGQLQYELLHVDDKISENIFRNHDDVIDNKLWPNLYPHGAVILENDVGPNPTCIGILNFTEEGLISPVFFTPETFTGEVQLYYPTDVQEEASPEAMEPTIPGYENQSQMFSSAGGTEDPDGASQTNDDLTVYPDDYTLQYWQKLYEEVKDENTKLLKQRSELYEVKDENTKLKQQSEDDQRMISRLKKEYSEQNEKLRAENESLHKRYDNLSSRTEELLTKWEQRLENRDVDYSALLTENEELKTDIKALRDKNTKLLAENSGWRKDWFAESEENEKLRAQYNELKTKYKEALTENEALFAMADEMTEQLKKLLNYPDSAVYGVDTSNIKDSNNVKAEEPSGSSANSLQGVSEEKPFLDGLSQDVSPDCI